MVRKSISSIPKDTLAFFGMPISFLLREQLNMLRVAVAVTEAAMSSTAFCLPLFFISLPETAADSIGNVLGLPAILAAYYIISLSTASLFGSLSDRIGRRPLLIVGTLLAGLSLAPFPLIFALYQIVPDLYWALLIANSLKGMASAMVAGPLLAIFADLSPRENHGETMGKFYLARSAGGAIGLFIGGFAWEFFQEMSFLFFAVIMLAACALYVFRLNEPKRVKSLEKGEAISFHEIAASSNLDLNPFKTMIESLQDKQFRKFSISWLAYTTLIGAAVQYAPIILIEVTEENLGPSFMAIIFLIGVAIMGIIQPTIGKLSDKLGRKPFLILGVFGTSLLVATFTAILALDATDIIHLIMNPFSLELTKKLEFVPNVPIPFPHLVIVLMILVFLLCTSCFASSSLGMISDVTQEASRGREMGFTQALMSTGSILGTLIGGTLFQSSGTLAVMTFCFGLSLLASIIIIQFLYETSGFYHFTHRLV
ncbi:MAG: MFS transporter [Candidatus Heimdallarchaeota archaeon]|nr:MFS transporter [Candidatus Heimdallarchaeota archaeon]